MSQGCRICGVVDSTKSHLIPASLIHFARGGSDNLLMGTRFADGKVTTQSGLYDDDIMCATHEACLNGPDKYAIEFLRNLSNSTLVLKPDQFVIHGVDHEALVKFAAAVVWRCSVSKRFGMHQFHIGRTAEKKIEAILFHNAPVDFPRVFMHGIKDGLPHLDGLVYFPKLIRKGSVRLARFVVASMTFTVDIGTKPYRPLRSLLINGNSDVVTGFLPYADTPEFVGTIARQSG